jgi:hypothetical protein
VQTDARHRSHWPLILVVPRGSAIRRCLGELSDAPRAAAEFTEHASGSELGIRTFIRVRSAAGCRCTRQCIPRSPTWRRPWRARPVSMSSPGCLCITTVTEDADGRAAVGHARDDPRAFAWIPVSARSPGECEAKFSSQSHIRRLGHLYRRSVKPSAHIHKRRSAAGQSDPSEWSRLRARMTDPRVSQLPGRPTWSA